MESVVGISKAVYDGRLQSNLLFFFSSRRRHTRFSRDWSSDVCSSDLALPRVTPRESAGGAQRRYSAQSASVSPSACPSGHCTSSIRYPSGSKRKEVFVRSEERRVGKECGSWRRAHH